MNHAILVRANLAIAAAIVGYHAFAFFALPWWLLPHSAHWAWLLLPLAWSFSTQWGMIHEAIHKIALPEPIANERLGRLLSVLMGSSFAVLRFGHLMHHQLNRHWQSEMVERPGILAGISYYFTLTVGLYLSEVVGSFLLALLPRSMFSILARRTFFADKPDAAVAGERFFYERGNIQTVRQDAAMGALLYILAFLAYGTHWPILLGLITLRALVLSLLDNIYHYDTPGDNSKASKELALPRYMSVLLLHANYHETHHLNPQIPWACLPSIHGQQARRFDGDLFSHGLAQFAGPIARHAVRPAARRDRFSPESGHRAYGSEKHGSISATMRRKG